MIGKNILYMMLFTGLFIFILTNCHTNEDFESSTSSTTESSTSSTTIPLETNTFGCSKYYAVLISTNDVKFDDRMLHSEWWYDLFMQYKMLLELGFIEDNIYVLYGMGNDFNSNHHDYNSNYEFQHEITDMECNKSKIRDVFLNLSTKMNDQDCLYVWWMGHGEVKSNDMCDLTLTIHHTGEEVSDIEFVEYLNMIKNYKSRWINIMTCYSGGIIDNLNIQNNKTITFSSSSCDERSYDKLAPCNVVHAEFDYDQTTAYREKNPCDDSVQIDANGNRKVEMNEAFEYIYQTMYWSTPQKSDPDNMAAATVINTNQ